MSIFSFSGNSHSYDLRKPAVAGQFYSGSKQELSKEVDSYLKNVPKQALAGKAVAFMVPHAGYVFSAQTAAYAYKILSTYEVDNVIIIGNSHHYALNKGAIYSKGAFQTPLGNVKINITLAQKLLKNKDLFEDNPMPHMPEHSLEVQLPFLQKTLKDFQIVPILLSQMSLEKCKKTGEDIVKALKELNLADNTIIIASTDMSHFPSQKDAENIDNQALDILKNFDPVALKNKNDKLMSQKTRNLACVFCGEEALYSTMYAAKSLGADKAEILNYSNSGQISGDSSRVVGYGCAAFIKSKNLSSSEKSFSISKKGQKELLKIARQSIEEYLNTKSIPKFNVTDPELTTPTAVFVTLNKNGRLRGCIGNTEPRQPLYEAVSHMAISAAFQDSRFSKVTKEELKDIKIEISALSPMIKAKDHEEIQQNKHGVLVQKGPNGGLFLPQVWEHFNTKEAFMNELCWQKAGLSPQSWKDPKTNLYIFTVFAFEEE